MPSTPIRYTTIAAVLFLSGYSANGLSQEDTQNPPKESYKQQLQQLMDNTDANAKSQFDKNYPKPSVPKTPQLTENAPPPSASDADHASKDKKQPDVGWVAPPAWQQPEGWQQPGASSAGSTKSNSQNSQNIYAPSGSSNNSSAPNPYK